MISKLKKPAYIYAWHNKWFKFLTKASNSYRIIFYAWTSDDDDDDNDGTPDDDDMDDDGDGIPDHADKDRDSDGDGISDVGKFLSM